MKDTNELLNALKKGENIGTYLEENETEFVRTTVSEYLQKLITEKSLEKSDIIQKSGLDRTYAYQIFNGTRIPSRDKLILLAVGMKLSLDETQKLLKYCSLAPLYAKLRRDSTIIYGLVNGMNAIELNSMLYDAGEKLLDSPDR